MTPSCGLWCFLDPDRLKEEAKSLITDKGNSIYFSAASSWEIAVKTALGKLRIPEPAHGYVPSRLADQGMSSLAIEHAHALRVFSLPSHHRDPFDRMLVAQSQVKSLSILTAYRVFAAYDVEIIWGGHRRSP